MKVNNKNAAKNTYLGIKEIGSIMEMWWKHGIIENDWRL